jgi:pimeloyl-ACP methyl ester carboxylesterase
VHAPRQLTIDLPALTVAALSWGPDDGPLALCLHGFPDTAWTWRHLGPFLAARGWRVVAPFSRGYAPTDVPADGDYRVGALMDDAIELHRALGGDDRAVVIGHDWGAATVHALGAHAPAPFSRIVALAVPPTAVALPVPSGPRYDWRLMPGQLRRSWYMLFNQLPWLPERLLPRLVPQLWSAWSPGFDGGEDVARVAAALGTPERRSAALGYYRAMPRPGKGVPSYTARHTDWLGIPTVPTLYLHGADDGCIGAGFVGPARAALPAGSVVDLIQGAGHFLQLERPDAVNARIAEFLGPAQT